MQIRTSQSPVSLAKDVRSWLEGKGWLLNSEDSTSAKLSDILFSVTLTFKLPADASAAIRAVAFMLHAHSDDCTAVKVSDHVIDKMINKISNPLAKFNDALDATKGFLDATTQKQASELLALQDAVKQQTVSTKLLMDASDNITQPLNPRGLSDLAWPLLVASSPPNCPRVPLGPNPHCSNSILDPKVTQRVVLASKQLLIDYSPLDEGEESHPRTIDEQRELRQTFNDWVDAITSAEADEGQPPRPPHM